MSLALSLNRQRAHSRRGISVAGIFAATLFACTPPQPALTITDFSKPVRLQPGTPGKKIVGLILETELSASSPIDLHLGCHGRVEATLTVPAGVKWSRRLDWYSDCAEVTFSVGQARATSLILAYQFQSL